MKKILAILLLSLIIATSGCIIKREGNMIIIDFSNITNTTPSYTYERLVKVGENLTIKEINTTIIPDYDPREQRFFFRIIQSNKEEIYWEPMNITISDVTILGKGYFTGTTAYIANITIVSPRELTLEG
uniref:Uncharacterized protein n=1 Tax=Pyrococcus abyssi TaxID=29292 RepID=A0A5J6XTF3_PYRAY|nr:hypothetical protein [Pyrococcus abyssi]QFN51304.1 hypothetical protein [Pyrococcus abyssi]